MSVFQTGEDSTLYSARSARFTPIITTDAAGITISAFFNLFGSPPAIEPM